MHVSSIQILTRNLTLFLLCIASSSKKFVVTLPKWSLRSHMSCRCCILTQPHLKLNLGFTHSLSVSHFTCLKGLSHRVSNWWWQGLISRHLLLLWLLILWLNSYFWRVSGPGLLHLVESLMSGRCLVSSRFTSCFVFVLLVLVYCWLTAKHGGLQLEIEHFRLNYLLVGHKLCHLFTSNVQIINVRIRCIRLSSSAH